MIPKGSIYEAPYKRFAIEAFLLSVWVVFQGSAMILLVFGGMLTLVVFSLLWWS